MIEKDEIRLKAKEFETHEANVERDYVYGWVLAGIYSISDLQFQFILKGGNCLRKGYFENTRFSNDLDFSISSSIDQSKLIIALNQVCDWIQEQSGIEFLKDRNIIKAKSVAFSHKTIYEAKLYFKDFYGNPNSITISIRLDITELEKIYLPIQERFIIHPYSDANQLHIPIKCMKLEEILANKLICMLQRRQTQDLYDFVFSFVMNNSIEINRSEIVTTFLKKTIFEPSPGVVRNLLVELPIEVLNSVWNKYIACPIAGVITFSDAVLQFRTVAEALFGGLPAGRSQLSYFPSALRTPIMDAGRDMKLLSLTYDGVTRKVEPYSLVFKRRQDGEAHEYFYGYDQTGGRNSGPDIKSFFHYKIQNLVILDEKFEPRYEIELSKAGELGDKTYFSRPFSRKGNPTSSFRLRASRQRNRYSSGTIYRIKCIVCGKTFTRSTYSTRINKHKDQYGNYCLGRTGYLT